VTELKTGILLWSQAATWPEMTDAAKRVDELGYDHLWTWDHLYAIFGDPYQPIFEGWMALAGWAMATERTRLGLLVGANTFRNPGLTAKLAETLDHISDGRAILGIGGAWMEPEHQAHGIDFGSGFGQRLDWMDEAVAAMRTVMDGGSATSSGDGRYAFDDLRHAPLPIQKKLPIMIGGSGEKKTLRMVAEMADLCNIGGTADVVRQKLAVLDEHLDAVGRPRDAVKRTNLVSLLLARDDRHRDEIRAMLRWDENPDVRNRMVIAGESEAIEAFAECVAAGVDEILVNLAGIRSVDAVHAAAEVLTKATA